MLAPASEDLHIVTPLYMEMKSSTLDGDTMDTSEELMYGSSSIGRCGARSSLFKSKVRWWAVCEKEI